MVCIVRSDTNLGPLARDLALARATPVRSESRAVTKGSQALVRPLPAVNRPRRARDHATRRTVRVRPELELMPAKSRRHRDDLQVSAERSERPEASEDLEGRRAVDRLEDEDGQRARRPLASIELESV